jgi:hypothetical protein
LTQVDPSHKASVCRCQEPRRSAKTAAEVEHAGTGIEAESLGKLPGGSEAAHVELIERREVRPPDDPVREFRASQRPVDASQQRGRAIVIEDTI